MILEMLLSALFCVSPSTKNLGICDDDIYPSLKLPSPVLFLNADAHLTGNGAFGLAVDLLNGLKTPKDLNNQPIEAAIAHLNSYRLANFFSPEQFTLLSDELFWEAIESNPENFEIAFYYLRGEVLRAGGLKAFFSRNVFIDSQVRSVLLHLLYNYAALVAEEFDLLKSIHRQQSQGSIDSPRKILEFFSPPYQCHIDDKADEYATVVAMISRLLGLPSDSSPSSRLKYLESFHARVSITQRALILNDLAPHEHSEVLDSSKRPLVEKTIPTLLGLGNYGQEKNTQQYSATMRGVLTGHFLTPEQLRALKHFLHNFQAQEIFKKDFWTLNDRNTIARSIASCRADFADSETQNYLVGALANLFAPIYFDASPFDSDFQVMHEVFF